MLLSFFEERNLLENMMLESRKVCSKCGEKTIIEKNRGKKMIKCSWRKCRASVSLWKGTIFEQTKIEPEKLLLLIHLWMRKLNAGHICNLLCISKKAFSRFITKLSKRVVPKFYAKNHKIGGNDVIVEVDESKFGLRKYHRGHRVEGVWVLGGVERTPQRKIFLKAVSKRDKETLINALINSVTSDSILYTDCWRGYSLVKDFFKDHQTVNHSVGFKDPTTGIHTNTIEGNWSAVKAQTPPACRTTRLVSLYLIRFMMLRNEGPDAFKEFIKFLI